MRKTFWNSKALLDVLGDELDGLKAIKAELRTSIKPEMERVRETWIDERVATIKPEDQEKCRASLKRAVKDRRLLEDFVLYPSTGGKVTVKEVLGDPKKWNNKRLCDPLEPDYGNDPRIAVLNLEETGNPTLWSHAHGGQRYALGAPNSREKSQEENKNDERIAQGVSEINEKHALIMIGGRACILREYWDPEWKRDDIMFWGIGDFHNRYSNRLIYLPDGDGEKGFPVTKLWMKNKDRREYDGFVFAPNGGAPPTYYNLFRGFSTSPVPGRWALFKKHIFEIVSGGDAAVATYIIAWLAYIFQNPGGERPGTALVFRGRQGTGKGVFVNQIGKVFGHHFLHITQASHLVGKFNSHLKDALLVFVDEALWAGDKAGESVLKSLITEDRIMIEHKGKDAIAMKNHASFMIASNNEWVVPSGMEERRFVVVDVSDKRLQDRTYFRAIIDEMNNGGREAMLHDLLSIDLSDFDLRSIPQTQAGEDQKSYSMTGAQKFWKEILMRGTLLRGSDEWEEKVVTNKLYANYLEFCKNMNDRYPLADSMFVQQIRKLCKPGVVIRVREDLTEWNEEVHSNVTRRRWVLRFPPLDECRKSFDILMHRNVKWEGD